MKATRARAYSHNTNGYIPHCARIFIRRAERERSSGSIARDGGLQLQRQSSNPFGKVAPYPSYPGNVKHGLSTSSVPESRQKEWGIRKLEQDQAFWAGRVDVKWYREK
ncbi:hypothetical protein TWF173_003557 [Orbilia oligospora]|uniref:Uncharacterized protein n=1 Tax=Orbilia oligospora TaxID=2813651 RepID=A0A7C8VBI8_ORBOL|nr:hypothetical protein TWF970_007718 [Orbilia oligospora]KAF3319105.1 hypothetical protein TWF173_003557 [Orbilia oligospora]